MINVDNFYTILQYFFLGLLQGVTEPIPISSSGHVELAQYFFNLNIEGFTFLLLVNSASLVAVIFIYRHDLQRLCFNSLLFLIKKKHHYKSDFLFVVYLIIATLPAGILGIMFEEVISTQLSKNIKIIGITLLITGFALWKIKNMRGNKGERHLKLTDAIVVGLAQSIALVPGISRSGATIVAAIALGMKHETALRFSFLLYIPVSLGGMILSFKTIASDPNVVTYAIPYTIAFLTALVATYFSLRLFMHIIARGNLQYFAYYCFLAGTAIVLFL